MSVDLEELRWLHAKWLRRGVAPHDIEDLFRDIPAIIAALERAERVEAAAQEVLDVVDFLLAGTTHHDEPAFAALRAALAPAPGEEGKG